MPGFLCMKDGFFSKKILPNPDSPIYFLSHGCHKALDFQSGCSSGVERNLAKVDVVGSNPIIRSICPSGETSANLGHAVGILNNRLMSLRQCEEMSKGTSVRDSTVLFRTFSEFVNSVRVDGNN